MNKRDTILALGLGLLVGYLAGSQMLHSQKISPEKALDNAKEAFKKQGPISGSWIYMKPEEVEKNGLLYNAYRGGITRNIDGTNKQYEFYTDVDTGTVISSVATT